MKQMTGTCKFCGQAQIVQADSQEDADRMAAESCGCDNILKKYFRLDQNIEQLCGEESLQFGMDIVEEKTIDAIKMIGRLCIYGTVTSAGFRLADSSITIKQIKDGVSISRKKIQAVKLEA